MYSRGKTIAKLVNSMDQFSCPNMVGDILVSTGRNAYDGVEFHTRLKRFKRLLHQEFERGVSIVTRSDEGRLHCHIAVEMKESCSSFDWIAWEEAERYYKLYKIWKGQADLKFYQYYARKYRASLPASWREVNRKLMSMGKKYGLGRVYLTPVRKSLAALKWYYVGNIPYKQDIRDKGVQYFTSWGMHTISKFQVLNKFTKEYWRKLRKFSEGLQLTSENYNIVLRQVIGQRWFFRCKDLIRDIDNPSIAQTTSYHELNEAVQLHNLRSS